MQVFETYTLVSRLIAFSSLQTLLQPLSGALEVRASRRRCGVVVTPARA